MKHKNDDIRSMKPKQGFTLIELLVVVAIIGVLVAILLPALSKARDQAKQAICSSNLRQFDIMYHMHSMDFNGYLCPPEAGMCLFPYGRDPENYPYPLIMRAYLRDPRTVPVTKNGLTSMHPISWLKEDTVREPAKVMLLMDWIQSTVMKNSSVDNYNYVACNNILFWGNIHNDGMTFLYYDDHCSWYAYKELQGRSVNQYTLVCSTLSQSLFRRI